MRVLINHTPHELAEGATVADAAQAVGAQPPYAVAVNLQFVPKTQHASTTLQPNDAVEIIAPVTGG
jgi:sulfur carrier protein